MLIEHCAAKFITLQGLVTQPSTTFGQVPTTALLGTDGSHIMPKRVTATRQTVGFLGADHHFIMNRLDLIHKSSYFLKATSLNGISYNACAARSSCLSQYGMCETYA